MNKASPRPAISSDLETAVQIDENLELRLWLRLLTCSTMVERRVRRNLRSDFGITLPRFDVLAQLDRVPDGITMGELSKRLMVSNGNLTGLIDKLLQEGLVSKTPLPHDRRTHLVRLTGSGQILFNKMAKAHESWIEEMMSGIKRKDLSHLLELLGGLKNSLRGTELE